MNNRIQRANHFWPGGETLQNRIDFKIIKSKEGNVSIDIKMDDDVTPHELIQLLQDIVHSEKVFMKQHDISVE